jgi:hypothetical protein
VLTRVQAPPPKQPPHVSTFDASSYVSGYHVPFRMYLPSVIASGSSFTSMTPVRVFKPASHQKELALTFVTGAGNVYYQVIETNWTDAPILRSPTGKYHDTKTGRFIGWSMRASLARAWPACGMSPAQAAQEPDASDQTWRRYAVAPRAATTNASEVILSAQAPLPVRQ